MVLQYAQDVSPESYLQRAPTGRPKGLAPDREYVIINYLNTPGSIEESYIVEEGKEEEGKEILEGEGSEEEDATLSLGTVEDEKLVKQIVDLIKNANESGGNKGSLKEIWPGNDISTITGKNVVFSNGTSFKMAIARHSTYLEEIKTDYYSVETTVQKELSYLDIFKYIVNRVYPFFERTENSGEENLRIFRFFDTESSNNYLSISINEQYANNLGYYLFGSKWLEEFTEQDRKWVLYLYSPKISDAFRTAEINKDILEQRRLTYYALTNRFIDANQQESDFIQSSISAGENALIFKENYAASLRSNPAGENGLTVYTFSFQDGFALPDINPYQYEAYSYEYEDINYPVDVKLHDGEGVPALGNNFYTYDFKGKYWDVTSAAGPAVKGKGAIIGYLKGFGYCEFDYTNDEGFAWNVGAEGGTITGNYIYSGTATPISFAGTGKSETIGAGYISIALWEGFKDANRTVQLWEGESSGLGFSVSIPGNASQGLQKLLDFLNITGGEINTNTTLIFPEATSTTISIFDKYYYGE